MKIPKIISVIIPTSLICLLSCQSLKYSISTWDIQREIKKSDLFGNQFTGFTLYDPETGRYLCRYNDHLLFTPASNTKILTALACLQALGDSIPSFAYSQKGDSLFLSPLADPTFLHPGFPSQRSLDLFSNKSLIIKYPEAKLTKYGSGWAWDDYEYDFQPERSWFPIYGNVVRIYNQDSMRIAPEFFRNYTQVFTGQKPGNLIYRWEYGNIFNAWIETDTSTYTREIPFIYTKELLQTLLTDTLSSKVVTLADSIPAPTDTLFSQSRTFTLAMMMQRSDNFLAEQLLVQCALVEGHTNIDAYRSALLKRWQPFLPQPVRWVDGSGLSRYNLISPTSLTGILDEIYKTVGWSYIETIFPVGGASGTIKNWYAGDEPFIFAKTGTLSNNHNLSGFIKTSAGKVLIFSLMNNHFSTPTCDVKLEMQRFLTEIRDAY